LKKDPRTKKILDEYPSNKKIINFINKIRPLWEKDEKRILKEISKITGLKWKHKVVRVYLVGNCMPYSDPLTMYPYKNKTVFMDVLTHELIHQIQSQNSEIFQKWVKYMKIKYKGEILKTKSHIFLHAVHKELYLNLFNKKRLEMNLKRSQKKAYKRAWEIVQDEGSENIIAKFNEIINK
jgi:hypothetical protein